MQTVTPVDVRVENDWRDSGSYVRKSAAGSRTGRQIPRMRTCVITKAKPPSAKSPHMLPEVTASKANPPVRSQSPSPTREPWVPPPGRSTKGHKYLPQVNKTRLEISPSRGDLVTDDVTDEDTPRAPSRLPRPADECDSALLAEIQTYEKRIQGLTEGVEILKERVRHRRHSDQTDQLRSDIASALRDLEQSQQASYQTTLHKLPLRCSRSSPPSRHNYRSSSAGEQRNHPALPRVSFQHDPLSERRRARSTTPVRGPLHLTSNRERLLVSLSQSEADIAQITQQLSSVKDVLTKLKFDDHPVSLEIERLYQQRNQLLHLIEQFEYSNRKLKQFLRQQYHLEAEDGVANGQTDTIVTRVHELHDENTQIRRLLLDRENDNVALQTELERVRTHAIGYDTMKTSLEQNRAHLQRELYAKEGEINRLQCILRSMERDLQRNRSQCDSLQRSLKRTSSSPLTPSSSLPSLVAKTKGASVEKLQAKLSDREREITQLEKKLYGSKNEQLVDASTELVRVRTRLEHAERLAAEYKEQLHNQTLKTSINNSKELDKLRVRLQQRIEELEPLPELLRQAELKNQDLQARLHEQEKRLTEQAVCIAELNSRADAHHHLFDRFKESHYSFDNDHSTFAPKSDSLQRQVNALEEDNAALLRNLNAKEEALRNTQARLNAKAHELTSMNKQIDATQTDLKTREETFTSKERSFQQRINDLEQQLTKLRLDCTQLKREKDDAERRYTSQLGELRDKLEQSNNNNRSIQSYVTSLKTTYASVFNDTLPASFASTSLARFSTTPSVFP